MSLLDLTGRDLLAAFSADTPTPGGGSASAYAGAMGASLLAMVSHLKKTRNNSDEERAVLVDAGAKLLALRDDLARLTDDDTAAFDAVMAAFKRPKATDEEKSARTAAVQAASLEATVVPLRVMQAASDALMLALTVARFGNRNAASDVHVGVSLLLAAVGGANENVEINLPSLTDEARRLKLREDAAIVRTRAAQAASQAKAALRP
ncbi:MAG: cyclodeaminase/cyclohydrolase family protein [Acidobacteria bacterium]|nr:cyclodeaminase/cyclohydrolase family protein [Acidobacteriota bacterium]